jgi:glycosyltransferase involved in cell wall biosynthesis
VRWAAFGTYDERNHPRVAVLIEGLRAAGDEVVEVNEPLRLSTADRVRMLGQPWRLPVLAVRLLRCWTRLAWRSRRVHDVDAVLVGYLGHFDVRLARLLFPRTPVVLDHLVSAVSTARDRALVTGHGVKYRLLAAIDSGALRRADVVVVDTPEHRRNLPEAPQRRSVVVAVGATSAWFAQGRLRVGDIAVSSGRDPGMAPPALRIVFVGVFTPLHGTAVIGGALAELADDPIDVTMVGSGQELTACRAAAAGNRRVTWVDWVPAARLPELVASHDVSLGIFGTTPKAFDVVPNKVFQGLATATAVVTSDTRPQREALGDAALLVPPGDVAALVAALRGLAYDRAEVLRLARVGFELALDRYHGAALVAPVRAAVATVEGVGRG